MLAGLSSKPSPSLSLHEPGCTEIANNVDQSVAAALDGSVFWMSLGDASYMNDNGGHTDSTIVLVPMVSDGAGYQPKDTKTLPTPLEGDAILSPSSNLCSRVPERRLTRARLDQAEAGQPLDRSALEQIGVAIAARVRRLPVRRVDQSQPARGVNSNVIMRGIRRYASALDHGR